MADVFVSYSKTDKERVTKLVHALEGHGLSVWWDTSLEQDADFAEKIRQEIAAAKCVIVCWSEKAAESFWVRGEADDAREQKKYTGILIANGRPPLPFNGMNCSNLANWQGGADHPALLTLLSQVGKMTGRSDIATLAASQQQAQADEAARQKAAAEAERVRRVQEEQRLKAEAEAEKARRAEEEARRRARAKAARKAEVQRRTRIPRFVFNIAPLVAGGLMGAAVWRVGGAWDSAAFWAVVMAAATALVGWGFRARHDESTTMLSYVVPTLWMGPAALLVCWLGISIVTNEINEWKAQARIREAKQKVVAQVLADAQSWTGRWSFTSSPFKARNARDETVLDGVLELGPGPVGAKTCRFSIRQTTRDRVSSADQTCRLSVSADGEIQFTSTVVRKSGVSWSPDNFRITSLTQARVTGQLPLAGASTPNPVAVVFVPLPAGGEARKSAPEPAKDSTAVAAPSPEPLTVAPPISAPVGPTAQTPTAPPKSNTVRVGGLGGAPAPSDDPSAGASVLSISGRWVGAFFCEKGDSGATITLTESNGQVTGRFDFYNTAQNPGLPTGAETVTGQYAPQTRRLTLRGERWISRPAGFNRIVIEGTFDRGLTSFSGRVSRAGCRQINLRRP
jgi:hypothetical protein